MGWSGGTYTKGNAATGGWTGDASLGIGIEAGRHDTQDNDFATGINQCVNKDGSNAATGNLNLGGFKYTNAAASTARTDLAQVAQVQDGDYIWLGTTGGTATAQTASASPAITAYKAGQKFRAILGFNSTGTTPTAHTLAINGISPAKNIVHNSTGSNPTLGSWVAGRIIELIYDGTNFVITNIPTAWQNYTAVLEQNANVIAVNQQYTKFIRINNVMFVNASVITTAASPGVGNISLSLPVNNGGGTVFCPGVGSCYRTSTGATYTLACLIEFPQDRCFFTNDASVGALFGASPSFAFANNERLYMSIQYEVA